MPHDRGRQILPLQHEVERIADSLRGKRDGDRAIALLMALQLLGAEAEEARAENEYLSRTFK